MKSPKTGIWDARWEKLNARYTTYLNQWLTVNARTEEGRRRGRLLARFITIMLVLSLVITINDLRLLLFASSSTVTSHLLLDFISLTIITALFISNKSGYVTLTAHLTLLLAVFGGSLLYAVYNNNFALIYFVFPIMMASFILKPYWSILYAGISTLGYSIAYLSPGFPITFNVEGILVFFALGVISFLSASRLEEAVKRAEQSGIQYRNLVERIPAIIYTAALDESKTRLYVSPQVERILGFTQAEYLADPELWLELLHPDDRQRILGEAEYFYATGEPFISEYRTFTRDGRVVWVHDEAVILNDPDGKPQLIQGVRMDITELKQMEEKIKTPLAQLASLRAIDVAIMSTHDLRMIFYILLSQTIAKLKVDAARILLFNSSSMTLEFGAAQGFLTPDIEKAHVQLGEEIAGQAAVKGILIDRHHLTKEFFSSTAPLLAEEGFTCFYAVPLISKGKIKGVLEVFERGHRSHNRDWIDFLNSLAGQAAIAIDNVSLFNELQRSNTDLRLAYESTLEGWSAALDLRDRETEGHTQRVTMLTEQIAKSMGITGNALLNIRRGSLLHDIGKVGVPDRILHKRGPLTSHEWKTMRKHPEFAYDMLSPIAYLHGALDIPYCHHEKWDGNGYPRGLKGEDIPLAARIFAVVDVYDALISNRPYREGWSKRKALKYIREQAGIHFDPRVVEVFMHEMKTK
jgi:PAS domain S-box-containing protein